MKLVYIIFENAAQLIFEPWKQATCGQPILKNKLEIKYCKNTDTIQDHCYKYSHCACCLQIICTKNLVNKMILFM